VPRNAKALKCIVAADEGIVGAFPVRITGQFRPTELHLVAML